jgi:hypothetical protein
MFTATTNPCYFAHVRYGSRKTFKPAAQRLTELLQCDFEPKTEPWYNHHFSVAKNFAPYRRIKPYNALSRLNSESLELQLPYRQRQDPLDFASLDRADDATLSSCLELYIA